MFDHDAAYKSMFSIPRAVEDLLREFIDEEWVEKLDFSTLEQINGSFVTDRWRRKMTDTVWKVRLADQELYICLLVEFQSTIDSTMALRVASYVTQLYLDLCKDPKRQLLTESGKLPPVLPIVLYNGAPRWSAPLELDELIEAGPGKLPDFRPHMRYMLLDQGAFQEQDLHGLENVVADIFRLENADNPEAGRRVIRGLKRYLAAPEHEGLRQVLKDWITRVLIPSKFPQLDWPAAQLDEISDLQGVEAMMTNKMDLWAEEFVKKGEARGEARGEAKMLRSLLQHRYGQLPDWVENRLACATSEQLDGWAKQVFSASSVEEVFSH
ncbi:transposase [Chitinimonas arctica]|uniref:Transposase n=1 Tax=Chitinimonas arctica TaxID=2594795 RepID=A0A516SHW5_9NEIS|nr:Rpn family recombination-promoting nuclease/putative transposase [Chitinimonas arctica]QDQ27751.1 transposase [Chitinimonas arctica]